MNMKKILLFSALGLSAACGRSSHQVEVQELPLPPSAPTSPPNPTLASDGYSKIHNVPLIIPAQLTQKDLRFGEVTILDSTIGHEFILPVTNTGLHTLCFVRIDYKPAGETQVGPYQQFTYAEGQRMSNGKFISPCIAAGDTSYFMSYIESSEPVLKGFELLDVSAETDDDSTPVKQVELVDQSISGSEVRVVLRNISGQSLEPLSFTTWLLRTPEKFLEWGFFDPEDPQVVAPGETFELYDTLYRGPLPSGTTLEIFPDFTAL